MGACLGFLLLGTHLIRKSILDQSLEGTVESAASAPAAPAPESADVERRNPTP
jgi:hypothetical protein